MVVLEMFQKRNNVGGCDPQKFSITGGGGIFEKLFKRLPTALFSKVQFVIKKYFLFASLPILCLITISGLFRSLLN